VPTCTASPLASSTRRLSPTSRHCSTVESVAPHRVAASRRPILPWACVILRGPPGCLACGPGAARLPAEAGATICCLECRRTGSARRASGLCGRLSADGSTEVFLTGSRLPLFQPGLCHQEVQPFERPHTGVSGSPIPTPGIVTPDGNTEVCTARARPPRTGTSWVPGVSLSVRRPRHRTTARPEGPRCAARPGGQRTGRARRARRCRRAHQESLRPAQCSVPASTPRSRRSAVQTRGGGVHRCRPRPPLRPARDRVGVRGRPRGAAIP